MCFCIFGDSLWMCPSRHLGGSAFVAVWGNKFLVGVLLFNQSCLMDNISRRSKEERSAHTSILHFWFLTMMQFCWLQMSSWKPWHMWWKMVDYPFPVPMGSVKSISGWGYDVVWDGWAHWCAVCGLASVVPDCHGEKEAETKGTAPNLSV